MNPTLQIDFVSDITCPWCAIGLAALEQALERVDGDLSVELRFQPFELNPRLPAEGQDIGEHLQQKYGSTPEQQAQMRELIRSRGAELGFVFNRDGRGRVWNTFDAHRLLQLAEMEGDPARQLALKKSLLAACHTRAEPMADHATLRACASEAGMDEQRAREVLASDEFAVDVRRREQQFIDLGISSVPAVIINRRYLVSGGQPVEIFEQALRQAAAEADPARLSARQAC